MRIIAGEFGSRRIEAPEGLHTRPTPERVREAVFSMLSGHMDSARVLDIFAGSGAMALEALSRGAAHAVLVDSDRLAGEIIQANIHALGVEDRATLLRKDFMRALPELDGLFDLVFMDPPYAEADALFQKAAKLLREKRLLAPDAKICVEHEDAVALPDGFALEKEKRYGRTHISLFAEVSP